MEKFFGALNSLPFFGSLKLSIALTSKALVFARIETSRSTYSESGSFHDDEKYPSSLCTMELRKN